MKRYLAWIWYAEDSPLGFIAPCTGIEQVFIFAFSAGVRRYRDGMVNMECCAAVIPLLAVETVYASEGEFIPEPISITVIVIHTRWTVPPDVGCRGVLESSH